MHYYIDGYNMLFRLMHSEEGLQSQREKIIYELNKKIALLKIDVSIVFDATYQIGDRTRSHYDQLEILFTDHGETADEFILEEICNSKSPRQETVVTSDKKLAILVRKKSAHTESVEEFLQWLDRVYKNRLKRLKNAEAIKPSLIPPKGPVPIKIVENKTIELSVQSSPEECADYYEQIFESKFQAIIKEEEAKPKKKEKTSVHKPKQKKQPAFEEENMSKEDKIQNEMERWLKVFEARSRK